jgi:hypothetical protein
MKISDALIFAATLGSAIPAEAGFINLNAPFDLGPIFSPQTDGTVHVSGEIIGTVVGYTQTGAFGEGEINVSGIDVVGQPTSTPNAYSTSGSSSLNFHENLFINGSPVDDTITATISWDSIGHSVSAVTRGELTGNGLVTASSGEDPFEVDFPIGSTFTIDALFICNRNNIACPGDFRGELIGGAITPTEMVSVPAPAIGSGGLAALLTLALFGVRRRFGRLRWSCKTFA